VGAKVALEEAIEDLLVSALPSKKESVIEERLADFPTRTAVMAHQDNHHTQLLQKDVVSAMQINVVNVLVVLHAGLVTEKIMEEEEVVDIHVHHNERLVSVSTFRKAHAIEVIHVDSVTNQQMEERVTQPLLQVAVMAAAILATQLHDQEAKMSAINSNAVNARAVTSAASLMRPVQQVRPLPRHVAPVSVTPSREASATVVKDAAFLMRLEAREAFKLPF